MSRSLTWSRGGDLLVPALAFATGIVVTLEFIVLGLLPLLAADLAVSLELLRADHGLVGARHR